MYCRRLFHYPAAALCLAGWAFFACHPASADTFPGVARLVYYTSPLDNSQQAYGVYLPGLPAGGDGGYPVVLHTHGYGWSVSANFSDFQRSWADAHGWILINLNARGPQFYEGVGDFETHQVIRDANQRFGIDLSRVFIVGGSMGGSGAFRHGIRYPETFAAAAGVDGWSDYREWHHHWYARTDMQDSFEEFRRPLLEACSPLYWTGRARWSAIKVAVSGQDNVVLPEHGLLLHAALAQHAATMQGAYDALLHYEKDKGHGGSYRIEDIYHFFRARALPPTPDNFLCESTVLTHGEMYWGRMDRLTVQGAGASLESMADDDTLTVMTHNLDEFTIFPEASPAGEHEHVRVYVDGFFCYEGPPAALSLRADRAPDGTLWGWYMHESAHRVKTAELEGPIGEVFKTPFTVVFGTAGTAAENARNQREAQDFVRGWNNFMVRGEGLRAIAEDRLDPADRESRSLVLFGTEDSSSLLALAAERATLPVRVRESGITVIDPIWGDRQYVGPHFGAFFCYPNPLNNGKTYLLVSRGQWATQPDGTARQGLEYDMEKLPWGYPDYVVFNTDQKQLPHVLNVNNKPPVTCYEAAYFVEEGYFDQDWQPARAVTRDRVQAAKLNVSHIHADLVYVERNEEGQSEAVCIIRNQAGKPVEQARVTMRIEAENLRVISAVSNENGEARFALRTEEVLHRHFAASVVNVTATGAVYDWDANLVDCTGNGGLVLRVLPPLRGSGDEVKLGAEVMNVRAEALHVNVTAQVPGGIVSPQVVPVQLRPGERRKVEFDWDIQNVPEGTAVAVLNARVMGEAVQRSRPVRVTTGTMTPDTLHVVEVKGADIHLPQPYTITAVIHNSGESGEREVSVGASLLQQRRYLVPQRLTIPAGESKTVTWKSEPDEAYLDYGMHSVLVYVEDCRGAVGKGDFTVQ